MILAFLAACAPTPRSTDTPTSACDGYPEGAVRPMERGEVLYPYRWPEAQDLASGVLAALDLGQAACATDPLIDWSPFDILLFVSIPAW